MIAELVCCWFSKGSVAAMEGGGDNDSTSLIIYIYLIYNSLLFFLRLNASACQLSFF